MPKFVKKPIVIEAFQMTYKIYYQDKDKWPEWLRAAKKKERHEAGAFFISGLKKLCIRTREGVHEVSEKDWIIKGVEGELYPCKPSIFKKTYDPVK